MVGILEVCGPLAEYRPSVEAQAIVAGLFFCAVESSRRAKMRLPVRVRQPLEIILQPNVIWAVNFRSDTPYGGQWFRTFNVPDESVRDGFAIESDTDGPVERGLVEFRCVF